jgi:hypothetical protein
VGFGLAINGEVAWAFGFVGAAVVDAAASPAEATDKAATGVPVGTESVAFLLATDVVATLRPVLEVACALATFDGHQLGLVVVLWPDHCSEDALEGEAGKKGGNFDHDEWKAEMWKQVSNNSMGLISARGSYIL